jgi:hypothetical protein
VLPTKQDLHIDQGETFEFVFARLEDECYVPDDLSSHTAKIEARLHPKDPDVEFEITDITLGSDGLITIKMTSAETDLLHAANYYYDVQLTAPGGDISYPYGGMIFINHTVTDP